MNKLGMIRVPAGPFGTTEVFIVGSNVLKLICQGMWRNVCGTSKGFFGAGDDRGLFILLFGPLLFVLFAQDKSVQKIAVEVELYLNLCLLGGVTDGQEDGTIGFLPADEVRFCPADVLIGLITAFQPAHSENTS